MTQRAEMHPVTYPVMPLVRQPTGIGFFCSLRLWLGAAALLLLVLVQPLRAQVTLDLRDADLRNFVEIVSEATGRSFVLDPGVRGTVTVLAPDQMSPQDLFEVFLSVLELNRLTLIEGAGADRIVPMNVARELSSGGSVGLPSGFETRVIPVKEVPLQEVIEVVRPLLPAEAVIFEMSVEGLSVQFSAVLNNALVGGAQFDLPGRSSLTNLISSVSNGGGATLGSG